MQDSDIEDLLETHTPYTVNMAFTYHISKHSASSYGSIGDRKANGGLAGANLHVLERTGRKVSVTGIADHELPGPDIVTCVAFIQTNHGKVNMLMHEYAYYGRHDGGKQVITFLDGYATPLQCRSGLMYMSILGKPTDQDLDQYPHVLLTSPHEWDPSLLDSSHPNTHGYPSWAPHPSVRDQHDPRIDNCGHIHHRTVHTLSILSDKPNIFVKENDQQPTTIDYNKLDPYFGWVNADTIKKTFENSTQWAISSTRFPMRKHFKSRFPAFNIPCRNEAVHIPFSLIPLPLILVSPWPKVLLGKTLWSLMCIPCIPPSNLSTLWRIP